MRTGALSAVVVASMLLASCATDDAVNAAPRPVELRHDLGPLTARFPAVGAPARAAWVTWNSATGGAPGPTTYWIDAVITLVPSTTKQLIAQHDPQDGAGRPDVHQSLASEVPPGPFLTGAALDDAVSTSGWQSRAYLDPRTDTLVLTSIDD